MRHRDLTHLLDLLIASDPGLRRLRSAFRAVLTAGLSALILSTLGNLLHRSGGSFMVGVMVSMMGVTLVSDPAPSAQRVTTALLLPVAGLSLIAGTLVAPYPVVNHGVFLAVIFAAVYLRRYGPRGMALGTIAFMTFFFSLFFHAKTADLPWMLSGVAVALSLAGLIRFWLLPDRPARIFRSSLRAFRARLATFLYWLGDQASSPRGWTPALQRGLGRRLGALNGAALDLEDQLQRIDEARLPAGMSLLSLRERIYELELSGEEVGVMVRRMLLAGPLPDSERQALARALMETRRWLGRAHPGSPAQAVPRPGASDGNPPWSRPLEAVIEAAVPVFSPEGMAQWDAAMAAVGENPAEASPSAEKPAEASPSAEKPAEASPSGEKPVEAADPAVEAARAALHPMTRQAIQATLAGLLSMVAGTWISTTRWYWAVITAFIVFNQATTLGDILSRVWHRVLGTLVGIGVGLVIAGPIAGHTRLELGLIFACIFCGFYLVRVSVAWLVLFFTLMLTLLYSLLGTYTPEILYLRLVQTLVGAGAGALAATLVLPTHTRTHVRSLLAELLEALQVVFADAQERLSSNPVERRGTPGTGPLLAEVREIDRKLELLRQSTHPLASRLVAMGAPVLSGLVYPVSALVFYTRQLRPGRLEAWRDGPGAAKLRELLARIAWNLEALARALKAAPPGETPARDSTEDLEPPMPILRMEGVLEEVRRGLTERGGGEGLLHNLERIDQLVTDVARLLDLPAEPVDGRSAI